MDFIYSLYIYKNVNILYTYVSYVFEYRYLLLYWYKNKHRDVW